MRKGACILLSFLSLADARFALNGPILTLTLKDPQATSASTTLIEPQQSLRQSQPWLDLSSLSPNLQWEVTTLSAPLPYWVPTLKQLKARVGYQYSDLKRLPSWVEGTAKFATSLGELIVQPTHDLKTKRTTILMEASRGATWILARLGLAKQQVLPSLETVRASFVLNLPYVSVSSIRITPSVDLPRQDVACQVEAMTGGFGRTRAVLNLEHRNPTLSVVHQLDSRNTIAPTINLYNARIVYIWNILLGRTGSSSLRTKVDPTSAIELTWTDLSEGGGSWVTDIRLPLEATTIHRLAADIRVKRQFRF